MEDEPLIVVCGARRTGTTLLAAILSADESDEEAGRVQQACSVVTCRLGYPADGALRFGKHEQASIR